jgi:hypothetical protein
VEVGAYVREVEALFVALVGRGFALSSRDVGRVLKWHEDGVPLRIVLGTLDEAMRRRKSGEGPQRVMTLGLLERSIGAAMKRRAERMVANSSAAVTPVSDGWTRLRQAIEHAGRASAEPMKQVLRQAWTRVASAEAEGRDAWVVAAELDEVLTVKMEATLNAEGAAEMAAHVAGKVGDADKMSAGARAERESFERACYLRKRFEVPELVAVMLAEG